MHRRYCSSDADCTAQKRHRGPSNVKRAFQALTGADLALDYTVLPRATAERLVKLAPTESKVEAVLRRAYG